MFNNSAIIKYAGLAINKKPILKKLGGRILPCHAIMYIIKGKGFFQDEKQKQNIGPGTIFYLYPEKWHCFDPDTKWTEYWVLFDGDKVEKQFGKLLPETPLHFYGIDSNIISTYEKLYRTIIEGLDTDQLYSLSLLHSILGEFYHSINSVAGRQRDLVTKVQTFFSSNIKKSDINLEEVADAMNTGYGSLRKKFKTATGKSLKNYFIDLKINHAKTLLFDPSKKIYQVAADTGFDDQYYFSRLFKKKTGLSPSEFKSKYCLRR